MKMKIFYSVEDNKKITSTQNLSLTGRLLSRYLLFAAIVFSQSALALIPESVAHWPINEGTELIANDISGNGHHGILINNPVWNGNELRLDGLDDYIDVGALDVSGNALTLSAWVQVDQLENCVSHGCRIVSKATGTATQDHYWMLSTIKVGDKTRLRFRVKNNGNTTTVTAKSGDISNGEKFHIAAVYDGTHIKLYKNGIKVGNGAKTGNLDTDSTASVWIGGNPTTATSRPWKGIISDVRVFQDGLTVKQVNEVRNDSQNGDTTAPIISNIQVVATSTSATFRWETNEPANSTVDYGSDGTDEHSQNNSNLINTHSLILENLTADTEYRFIVSSVDSSNNSNSSDEIVFITATEGRLAGHWPINEGAESTANDISGNGHHGLMINNPVWSGSELLFDGIDDYIDVGTLDVAGNALTLSAWVRADQLESCADHDCRIFSKATGTATEDHYWMLSTIKVGDKTRLRFRVKSNGSTSNLIASSGDISNEERFHAAAVYDGETMRLYKNGIEVGSLAKTGNLDTDPTARVWIGGNPMNASSRSWKGTIAEVRLYQSALSASEINEIKGATQNSDTTVPVISNVQVTVTDSTATIRWETDEAVNGQISLGVTEAYENGTVNGVGILTTSHSITVTDLTQLSDYHFLISSTDASGNTAIAIDQTLTTKVKPDDIAPVISQENVFVTDSTITVTWDTDEPASSQLAFGTTEEYEIGSASNVEQVTSHSITLTGLIPLTTYYYQIGSTDSSDNTATSTNLSTMTDAVAGPKLTLIKDINQTPLADGSEPDQFIEVNGLIFFTADFVLTGRELWVTDGTEEGTGLVKDIVPGTNSSVPSYLTNVDGTLYFSANDFVNGYELWKSDGTDEGTVLVKDIRDGSSSSSPEFLTNVNGILYFIITGEVSEQELWKSDGTDEGTVMVKRLPYGNFGRGLSPNLINVDGTLYFSATDADNGRELWTSDGTDEGTVLVKDIRVGGSSSSPESLTNVNGILYFITTGEVSGQELWKSDGTAEGTVLVKAYMDEVPTSHLSRPPPPGYTHPLRYLTNVDGTLYFNAYDDVNGQELWKSDGTAEGTMLVKNVLDGSSSGYPSSLTDVNGTLYFIAVDETRRPLLWKSDGTVEGTVSVVGLWNSNSIQFLANVDGTLYLMASSHYNQELWKSDGTARGTMLVKDVWVKDLYEFGLSESFAHINGTLFFNANDGVNGKELWKSDGIAESTVLVKNIQGGNSKSAPYYLTNIDGTLYFRADDGVNGFELWKSNGTVEGTVLVKDIRDGELGSNPLGLINVDGTLYFRATDVDNGQELWKSDGTVEGTVLVKDINVGTGSSSPSSLINVDGTLYFSANDGVNGNELWTSDGTVEGTVLVKDIDDGIRSGYPSSLTNVDGTLYFSADDEVNGEELWKSDGTVEGTVLVKDIDGGTGGSYPSFLTNVDGTLYFSADDGVNGEELWKSDGTIEGTVLVMDIDDGVGSGYPSYLTNVNGTLYFRANDGVNGSELWKSNGTAEGTILIKDIGEGIKSGLLYSLTNVNGTLYFRANDGVNGNELWKSDGTTEGTVLVKDVQDGSISRPENLTIVNGSLYFTAFDSINGQKLWTSDGTDTGTQLVFELEPGETTELKYQRLFDGGDTLYINADDGNVGGELWRLD